MKVRIKFDTDNDAFCEDFDTGLREVWKYFDGHLAYDADGLVVQGWAIQDTNGNTIGKCEVTGIAHSRPGFLLMSSLGGALKQ